MSDPPRTLTCIGGGRRMGRRDGEERVGWGGGRGMDGKGIDTEPHVLSTHNAYEQCKVGRDLTICIHRALTGCPAAPWSPGSPSAPG